MTTTRPRRSRTASSRISIQINRPHADTQNCITTGDLVSKDSEPRDSVPSLPRSNDLGLEDEAGLGPVTVPLVTSGSKTDAMSMSNGSTDFNDIISDSDSSIDEDDAHDLFKSFIDTCEYLPQQMRRSFAFIRKYDRESCDLSETLHNHLKELTRIGQRQSKRQRQSYTSIAADEFGGEDQKLRNGDIEEPVDADIKSAGSHSPIHDKGNKDQGIIEDNHNLTDEKHNDIELNRNSSVENEHTTENGPQNYCGDGTETERDNTDRARELGLQISENMEQTISDRKETAAEAQALLELLDNHFNYVCYELAKLESEGFNRERYISERALRKKERALRLLKHSRPPEKIEPEEKEPRYCLCNDVSYGEMVACDNRRCPYEWFHLQCVNLSVVPNGKWYCPRCTKILKKKKKRWR